jgi:hypothetical protein
MNDAFQPLQSLVNGAPSATPPDAGLPPASCAWRMTGSTRNKQVL